MYIKRHAEKTVEQLSKMFGAVLVAGPRQVGKTTMLDQLTGKMNRATLDDPIVRASAEEESCTFFKDNPFLGQNPKKYVGSRKILTLSDPLCQGISLILHIS